FQRVECPVERKHVADDQPVLLRAGDDRVCDLEDLGRVGQRHADVDHGHQQYYEVDRHDHLVHRRDGQNGAVHRRSAHGLDDTRHSGSVDVYVGLRTRTVTESVQGTAVQGDQTIDNVFILRVHHRVGTDSERLLQPARDNIDDHDLG